MNEIMQRSFRFTILKKEFIGLQNMIKDLLEKHGNLEKKYVKFIQKQRKINFKCRGCSRDKIKCDVCEKNAYEGKIQQIRTANRLAKWLIV